MPPLEIEPETSHVQDDFFNHCAMGAADSAKISFSLLIAKLLTSIGNIFLCPVELKEILLTITIGTVG